jgi:hypothetical protein
LGGEELVRGPVRRGAWLALLLVPLVGCVPKQISLELPGFGEGAIDAVWLWRLSPESGRYERTCRLDLGAVQALPDGTEQVAYRESCAPGTDREPLEAVVDRSADDPETATLRLVYLSAEGPSTYRATAVRGTAESALSDNSIEL